MAESGEGSRATEVKESKKELPKGKRILILTVKVILASIGFVSSVLSIIEFWFGDNYIVNKFEGNKKIYVSSVDLRSAQDYYSAKEYKVAAAIYSSDELINDPIALNNMGYLYANTTIEKPNDFREVFNLASSYYKSAADKGYTTAISNWIKLNIKNLSTYRNLFDVLEYGYERNDMFTLKFTTYLLTGDRTEQTIEDYRKYSTVFMEKTEDEKKTLIDKYLYETVTTVPINVNKPYLDDDFNTYEYKNENKEVVGYNVYYRIGTKKAPEGYDDIPSVTPPLVRVIDPIYAMIKYYNKHSKGIALNYPMDEEYIMNTDKANN